MGGKPLFKSFHFQNVSILSIYQCQCCSHLSLILSTSSFSHILVCVAFFSSQISALGVFFFAEEIQLVNFWFIEPRLLDRKECWGVLEREPNSIPFVVDHPSRLLRGSNLKNINNISTPCCRIIKNAWKHHTLQSLCEVMTAKNERRERREI